VCDCDYEHMLVTVTVILCMNVIEAEFGEKKFADFRRIFFEHIAIKNNMSCRI
jgi:hypothetical protein